VRHSKNAVRANRLVATCRSAESLPALSKHLPCPGKVKVLSPLQKGFLFLVDSDPKKEKEKNKIFNAVSSSRSAPPLHRKSEDKAGEDSAERQVATNQLARTAI